MAGLGLVAWACTRSAVPGSAFDAGPVAPLVVEPAMHTDLRSAMILVFPDFREATVGYVQSGLVRHLATPTSGRPPLATRLEVFALGQGFMPAGADAGAGAVAVRSPFEVHSVPETGGFALELRLPMRLEDLGKLLRSPNALHTEQLVTLLPTPSWTRPLRQPELYFELTYDETSRTGDLLLRRLVEGLEATGFQSEPGAEQTVRLVDGGVAPFPESSEVVMSRPRTGSRIVARKTGREVLLRYTQRLPL
jgi:hypothetical protein